MYVSSDIHGTYFRLHLRNDYALELPSDISTIGCKEEPRPRAIEKKCIAGMMRLDARI